MTGMDMTIKWQRRRAEVTQNAFNARFNKVEEGVHPCHVLGLFQVVEDEGAQPYFVCELDDGRNIYAEPTQVRFLDTAILNREEAEEEAEK